VSDPPFRFRHPVVVRFKDIDVGGHAHLAEAEVRWQRNSSRLDGPFAHGGATGACRVDLEKAWGPLTLSPARR